MPEEHPSGRERWVSAEGAVQEQLPDRFEAFDAGSDLIDRPVLETPAELALVSGACGPVAPALRRELSWLRAPTGR